MSLANYENKCRTISFSVHLNAIEPGIFLAAFTSISYFLTVAKIVPYYENRYMYIIHPLLVLFLFSVLYNLLKVITLKQGLRLAMTVLIMLGLNVNYYNRNHIRFLNDSYPRMLDSVRKEYSNINMITVTHSPTWFPIVCNLLLFKEVPHTLMMTEQQLPEIKSIVDSLPSNQDSFLIYRAYNCKINPKEFLQVVAKESRYNTYKRIGQNFGEVYLFTRE